MKIVHTPTGIMRGQGPPVTARARYAMVREITAELIERGQLDYLLPSRK